MNFGAPGVLWALPLVAVPILIHLLQRRRTQLVDFAAMRFLAEALRRTRRRVLLEDMLLLLLRTLAVLALIMALAQPSTESLPLALGREARAEVLVVDASLSMDHQQNGNSSFSRGQELAAERLGALKGQLDDRAALLRAGLSAERLANGDPREVRKALGEMTPPRGGTSDLGAAILAARQTALDMGLPLDRVRITLLTDLQASQWPEDSPARTALARLAELGCAVEVIDCGADVRGNLAITGLELNPAQVVRGDTVQATFRVRNFAITPAEVEVIVKLDNDVVQSLRLNLGPQEEQEQSILLNPVGLGPRVLEVHLPHDALIGDDQRASVLEVRDSLQVLLVGDLALDPSRPGLVESLAAYLSLGADAPIQTESLPLSRLDDSALELADILILADPGSISIAQAERVVSFVQQGGGLMMVPGPNTGQGESAALLEASGWSALTVGEVARPGAEDAARLNIVDGDMPALRFFTDARWQPLLTEVPFLSYRPLLLDPALAQSQGLRVGLSYLTGSDADSGTALVAGQLGRGQAAWLSAAPLPGWNRMEEVPGGTLPLLYDLLFQLSPPAAHPPQTAFGAPLQLALPFPATNIDLRDPDGMRRSLAPEALGSAAEKVILLPRANRAGVWKMDAQMLRPDGSEDQRRDFFAVVNPVPESDLRGLSHNLFAESLPPSILVLRPEDAPTERPTSPDGRRQLTATLLMLMMAFLIGETLFAATLDRRRMGA